ncbi:MAG: hypothetical protein HY903_24655 [Deltaproteobacteria bacterium]|nr:hypothetical protein [Deltaproteobacteria bacterium]
MLSLLLVTGNLCVPAAVDAKPGVAVDPAAVEEQEVTFADEEPVAKAPGATIGSVEVDKTRWLTVLALLGFALILWNVSWTGRGGGSARLGSGFGRDRKGRVGPT